MPRAFMITNKRYNSTVEFEEIQKARETSPERSVSTAEGPSTLIVDEDIESGFESVLPSSPKSPAHESNGPSSPSDHISHQPNLPESSEGSSLSQRCVINCFTNTAIVTVIQQLMRHASHQVQPIRDSRPLLKLDNHPKTLDTHVCPECGKRYSTSSNLARHRQIHRSVTDKKARKCPHCEKVYVSIPAYSMHVRTHTQGCRCPYCGKCFSRPWLLQGHIRTHTGEKPFTCSLCQKAFADKSNLRAHVQTHSSSKPYQCHRCGKAFALKSYLYKHEESSCMRIHNKPQEKDEVGETVEAISVGSSQ